MAERSGLDRLSPRQLQVLQLLATGASARVIAEQLQIRPATVKQHVALVYRKLGVCNRVQAANVYLRATISRDSGR